MTTEKKLNANRKNALLSTGPKSDEGKAISSRNSIRHGIFSKEIVITKGEVQEKEMEFRELHDQLQRDLKPEGQMENLLVEKIAVNYWRLRRLLRYETGEIRQRLDEFICKYMGSDPEDGFSDFSPFQRRPPNLKYFTMKDEIKGEHLQKQEARIEALEKDRIDYRDDEETIDLVLQNRLGIDLLRATANDRKQAIEYLRNLSPQQKGKIKRELLGVAKQKYEEMHQVVKWQKRIEIIELIRSIPVADDLNKVIKYETALERSISKNLAMLRELQKERRSKKVNEFLPQRP